MRTGSIITQNDVLGIVYKYRPDMLAAHGCRVTLEDSSVISSYTELPEVTEFTPDVIKRLAKALPRLAFSVVGKDGGLTGTDPEIFAFDAKGVVIPAWKWLESKETSPELYYDGVQAEFVTQPTGCHNYQTDRVQHRLTQLNNTLKQFDPKAMLATRDVVKLDRETLLKADDKYIELGCSPSRNAYPEVKPINTGDPREHPFRYSGCHIHTSVMDYPLPPWFPEGTVVMIDKLAGVLLTALGRDMEDPLRRVAYGRAGEFRIPPPAPVDHAVWGKQFENSVWYRMEYRTPGSFLLHHPALFNFAVDTVRAAFRMGLIMDGRLLSDIPDVQGIINNCDADAASKLIQAKGSYYRQFLEGGWGAYGSKTKTLAILKEGAKASGRFGNSVADNWKLGRLWTSDNYDNGPTRWVSIVA